MRYIRPLTGLRFVAAALVYLHHLKFFFKTNTPFQGWLTKYVFHEGFIGVGFFFILSGFILAHRYSGADLAPKTGGLRKYFGARLARIYPLHLLTLLAMLAVAVSIQRPDLRTWIPFVSGLTLTQSFFPDYRIYFAFNSVSWSLSDELFFYVLFPFVFALDRRWFNLLLATLAGLVVLLAFSWKGPHAAWFFYAFPPVRFADFLIGIGLYRLYVHVGIASPPRFSKGLMLELAAALSAIVLLLQHHKVPDHFRYGCYYWLPLVLLIWSQVVGGGPVARLMSTRLLVYLGNVSFAFYMIHAMVLELFTKQLLPYVRLPWFETTVMLFVATTLLAMLVHHFIENPANRWLRNRLG